MLSLQFKPYDGVTELARQTKENMNCVALQCKRLTHARRELCVITEKGKWMTRRCGLFSQVSFNKKILEIQKFCNICYHVCKNISAGCLTAVSYSLTMHNKAIFNIYVFFNWEVDATIKSERLKIKNSKPADAEGLCTEPWLLASIQIINTRFLHLCCAH